MSVRESGDDQLTAAEIVEAFCAEAADSHLTEWGSAVTGAVESICRDRIPHPNLGYVEVLRDLARVSTRELDPLAGWLEGAPAEPVMDALAPYRAQLRLIDEMNQKVTEDALTELAWLLLDSCQPRLVWSDLESRGARRERPEQPDMFDEW